MKNPRLPQTPLKPVIAQPLTYISRAPAYALSPVKAQHPTESNSIAASVKPFGKPRTI